MDIRKFTQQFFEIYNFNLAKYSPFSRFSFQFSAFRMFRHITDT